MSTANATPRVEMKGISKAFPGVQALEDVDLTIQPNEIHGLVGENGAGKSVLLKILLGAYPKDTGEIRIDGEIKDIHSTAIGRREGLSAVWQDLMLAPSLTVAENICLGIQPNVAGWVNFKEMKAKAQQVCEQYGIRLDMGARVRDLIVAQQQMVAIAKALALDCRVLILDEPTAMLTDEETQILFRSMRTLKEKGVSIIYVSHRMEELFEICDAVTVLRDGRQVGSFPIGQVTSEKLIHIMSGRNVENLYGEKIPEEGRVQQETLLSVEDLTSGNTFCHISFQVRRGEILGIFGLVGSKRTDLLRAIFGVDRYTSGRVTFKGAPLENGKVRKNIRRGIGLVPEERMEQGVCTGLSVCRNLNMVDYRKVGHMGFMREKAEQAVAEKYIEMFRIKTPTTRQKVRNLSGGNQQKVAIGKWLNISPDLVMFDEPTVGVDVGAKLEIYNLIRDFAGKGGTIIMVSSYLPEIMGVCDRVLVMNNGRITGEASTKTATQEQILTMAFQEAKEGEG